MPWYRPQGTVHCTNIEACGVGVGFLFFPDKTEYVEEHRCLQALNNVYAFIYYQMDIL
jgi:hypothetical protein